MDWNAFLQNILEVSLAGVPIGTIIAYILSSVSKKTKGFGVITQEATSLLKNKIDDMKKDIGKSLSESIEKQKENFDCALVKIQDEISGTLKTMADKLQDSDTLIKTMGDKIKELEITNERVTDTLFAIVCSDNGLVRQGVAKKVASILLTDNVLDKKNIETTKENLKEALEKTMSIVGREVFLALIDEISNIGEDNEEKLPDNI